MRTSEVPVHPAISRNLSKIAKKEPGHLHAAKPFLERANHKLVTGYELHTVYDSRGNPLVQFPYSSISLDDLPINDPQGQSSKEFPSHTKTTSEQILDLVGDCSQLIVLDLSGTAPPGRGSPLDTERVNAVVDLMGHAAARRQHAIGAGISFPEIKVISAGLAVARGGKVSKEWTRQIREEGFASHGIIYDDLLTHKIVPQGDEKIAVVVFGESMACYTGQETAKRFFGSGPELYLYAKNPPGAPWGRRHPLLQKGQVVVGYGSETGASWVIHRVVFKNAERKEDSRFFGELDEYLEQEKGILQDNAEQKRLKWRVAAIDAGTVLRNLPFTIDCPGISGVTVERGVHDLTSITMRGRREWRKGDLQPDNENVRVIWNRYGHSSYYDPVIWASKLS
jgi:hypothetical protein